MPSGQIRACTNLTVSDPERSSALFQKLLGWHERWRGARTGRRLDDPRRRRDHLSRTLHRRPGRAALRQKGVPLNHVGLLVDDLTRAEQVVSEAGLQPFGHGDYEPGRRFYFFDWDGIEFEVVSYE